MLSNFKKSERAQHGREFAVASAEAFRVISAPVARRLQSRAMEVALTVGKGVLAWLLMMLLGTNLIGFAMSPFVRWVAATDSPAVEKLVLDRSRAGTWVIALVFWGLIILYLIALARMLSPLAAVAAVLLMISRIQDLFWERHNRKPITARQGGGVFGMLLMWLALPIAIASFL